MWRFQSLVSDGKATTCETTKCDRFQGPELEERESFELGRK